MRTLLHRLWPTLLVCINLDRLTRDVHHHHNRLLIAEKEHCQTRILLGCCFESCCHFFGESPQRYVQGPLKSLFYISNFAPFRFFFLVFFFFSFSLRASLPLTLSKNPKMPSAVRSSAPPPPFPNSYADDVEQKQKLVGDALDEKSRHPVSYESPVPWK